MQCEVVLNRRFGTTYHPTFEDQDVQEKETDVSGQTIGPLFKNQDVQEETDVSVIYSMVKMRRIGSPETSVLNHITPRNNTEEF